MSDIRAVVFDFDGIIVDTERLHYLAFQDVLVPLGAGYSWETYESDYIGFDDRDALREACRAAGKDLPADTSAELISRKARAFLNQVAKADIPPFPRVMDWLRDAKERGPVALCTGALASDIEPFLENLGLTNHFDAIVTADQVIRSKPDPESYALAATRLGIPAVNCLAIEDTPTGLKAARGAGCQTLGVAHTHSIGELTSYADRVIRNFLQICLADF